VVCRAPLPGWATVHGVTSMYVITDESIARSCALYFPEPARMMAQ
jgi:hypothetical protein